MNTRQKLVSVGVLYGLGFAVQINELIHITRNYTLRELFTVKGNVRYFRTRWVQVLVAQALNAGSIALAAQIAGKGPFALWTDEDHLEKNTVSAYCYEEVPYNGVEGPCAAALNEDGTCPREAEHLPSMELIVNNGKNGKAS